MVYRAQIESFEISKDFDSKVFKSKERVTQLMQREEMIQEMMTIMMRIMRMMRIRMRMRMRMTREINNMMTYR